MRTDIKTYTDDRGHSESKGYAGRYKASRSRPRPVTLFSKQSGTGGDCDATGGFVVEPERRLKAASSRSTPGEAYSAGRGLSGGICAHQTFGCPALMECGFYQLDGGLYGNEAYDTCCTAARNLVAHRTSL
jgi:hypothetical protein